MKVFTGIVKFTINNDTINNDTFYEQHVLCEADSSINGNNDGIRSKDADSDLEFYKNLYYTTKCKLNYVTTLYSTGYIPKGYHIFYIGKLIIEIIHIGVNESYDADFLKDVNFLQDVTKEVKDTLAKKQY